MRGRSIPKVFAWILTRLSIYEDMFSISGDFEIQYQRISEKRGWLASTLWLLGNTFVAVYSYFMLVLKWRSVMFLNYLKIAFRNIFRFRLHSLIKVLSLALGIAGCILIYLFIQDELSFDRFHEKRDRLFRVVRILYDKDSHREIERQQFLPPPMGPELAEFSAEIKNQSRFTSSPVVLRYQDKLFSETLWLVDSPFLEMFSFLLLYGEPKTALLDDHSIVLTRSHANKYFGDKNPMGRRISLSFGRSQKDFVVTGVVQDVPHNSSLRFDILIHARNLPMAWNEPDVFDQWNRWAFPLFVELEPEASLANAEVRIAQFASLYFSDSIQRHVDEGYDPYTFGLQKITKMRVDSRVLGTPGLSTAYLLSMIALGILLIACVNFTNLSLGLSMIRSTEVGMRKVLGASRQQLTWQFMGEAQLTSLIAVGLGVFLAEMLLPRFNSLSGKTLSVLSVLSSFHILSLMGITLFTGFLAGIYPALVMSSFRPLEIMKGRFKLGGRTALTKGLVVLQFALSITLAISALVMGKQASYMVRRDVGYTSEGLVVILTQETEQKASEILYQRFRSGILSHSQVLGISASNREFGLFLPSTGLDRGEKEIRYNFNRVDPDFISVMKLHIDKGRDFFPNIAAERKSAIVNQKFWEQLGPDFALNSFLGDAAKGFPYDCRVVGVIEDSHFRSVHREIEPLLLYVGPGLSPKRDRFSRMFVRIDSTQVQESLDFLKSAWKEANPYKPFIHYFQDDALENLYSMEKRWSLIIRYAFVFSILLACLGIFGLTAMTLSRRDKELGIRKVLGARAEQIVLMTIKDYVLLVAIANVMAGPAAYLILRKVLQTYPYRISIALHYFLLTAGASILVAALTVLYLSVRAALANPADNLRYE